MPAAPKHDPVRRNPRVGVVWLPANGREGDPPSWPLPDQTPEEADAWAQLWATPQAVAWEPLGVGVHREVARYCRLLLRTESADSYAAQHAQATALADRLGLTPKAMRLMLWQIAPDEMAERRAEKREVPEDELALRRRLIAGAGEGDPGESIESAGDGAAS